MKKVIVLAIGAALLVLLLMTLLLRTGGNSSSGSGDLGRNGIQGSSATSTVTSSHGSAGGSSNLSSSGRRVLHGADVLGSGSSSGASHGTASRRAGGTDASGTDSADIPLTPAILKQRAMKQLFAAAMKGSPREMWESLKEAGFTLSYEDYLSYLKAAKLRGSMLDRVDGAWDQLLQFWTEKDPAGAMAWAQANQLHAGYGGPDEIFYRMVTAWGSQDPQAAAAYAQGIPGFATTTRGQEVMSSLNGMTNRMSRLELLTTPAATLTDEHRREMSTAVFSLYSIPEKQVPDVARWLIANRATMDPATWERAMNAIAPRMTGIPTFDLIALVQSLPTTPGSQQVRSGLISSIAASDPQTAMSLAGDRDSDRISVLQKWSQNNPAEALKWVLNLPDPKTSTPYLGAILGNLDKLTRFPPIEGIALPDTATMEQTVERLRGLGGYQYNQACEWAARAMLTTDVNKAFEMAARSTSPQALQNLLGEWVRVDPAATLAWVNTRNDAASYAAAVKSVFPQVVRRDLDAAIAWSRQLQDRSLWLDTVTQLLPLTPYERWDEVLGGSQAPFKEPDIAGAAMSGAVRLGFNDFEGSVIAVDEVMRRMGLGETEAERQANWSKQPASVTAAFENSQQELIGHLAYHDPQGAMAWAEQWPWMFTTNASSMSSIRFAYSRWASDGSGKAQEWLNASKFTEEQRRSIAPPTVHSVPSATVPLNTSTPVPPGGGAFRVTTPMRGN